MFDQSLYKPFLEKVLTPSRLAHSLGVMQVMGELAEVYHLDRDKALTAGILHDAAKDLSVEKQNELIKTGNIQVSHECETNYVLYLHGPVGSFFVQEELNIHDELVLDAIAGHTYFGDSPHFEHPLSWCLRFSDILEPTRNWEQEIIIWNCAKRLRELVYAGLMKEGAFLQIGCLLKWYEEKSMPIHPRMREIKQVLGKELDLNDAFLELGS
ncbi:MAG: bis(5'-nucleosyl)-tetraphosphatase (symmetrical) YqeK [Methylococcales bacterium]|nr:bis(5'-nucleosyl)-tetraphosphatase (symmetrical) YqeK [Methylococcales bacterium]